VTETKNYAKEYYPAELMAAFIARNLQGFKLTGVGTYSMIPQVAIRLAQATHSPDLWFLNGPAGAMNCKVDKIAEYIGDMRFQVGAEYRFRLESVMDDFNNRTVAADRILFFGGFQIDKHGNVNMAMIGDRKKPKFRGPGTIGLMGMCFQGRIDLFTQAHSPRLFVEKADFISGPGYGDGPGWREKMGCPQGGGPRYVITPICIFDFDEKTLIMRLKSVHPEHTVEEVVSRTGFKPIIPEKVPQTEPPTIEELAFIRKLDPDQILKTITDA
jgi:glutaconate CoA-transferase, subunit B